MSSRRTAGWRKLFVKYKVCIYCGVPQEVWDHAVPLSVQHLAENKYLVPACAECNSLLHDSVQRTLMARIEYAKWKLEKRYHKLLTLPHWSFNELIELGPALRNAVILSQAEQLFARARIEFKYIQWRKSGCNPILLPGGYF